MCGTLLDEEGRSGQAGGRNGHGIPAIKERRPENVWKSDVSIIWPLVDFEAYRLPLRRQIVRSTVSLVGRADTGGSEAADQTAQRGYTPNGLSVMSRHRAISFASNSGVLWV